MTVRCRLACEHPSDTLTCTYSCMHTHILTQRCTCARFESTWALAPGSILWRELYCMQMRGPYHTIIALYCTGSTQPHSGNSSQVGYSLSVGAFVGVFTFTSSTEEVINHCGCASAFNVRCHITWHETQDTVCYLSFIYQLLFSSSSLQNLLKGISYVMIKSQRLICLQVIISTKTYRAMISLDSHKH